MRGAAGDADLRVMLAEVASAKACEMIRGAFRGLRDPVRHEVVSGILWMRDCEIENAGTNVTFTLGGLGWQWADKSQKKGGGTFDVHEYVKFRVTATLRGSLDIAYARGDHVVSLWFTPAAPPDIKFEPIGDVDVDERGLWSSVVGGISSIFGDSPDEIGTNEAKKEGTHQFAKELADGMTVAIDLCSGYQRFTLGRPPKGQLGAPEPGESHRRQIEIRPGGLMVFGPYLAPRGMTVSLHTGGPLRAGLACEEDIAAAAEAFVDEHTQPAIPTLAQTIVGSSATLKTGPQRCRVAVVVRSEAASTVAFDWQRPPSESARSTGGPAVRCARKTTVHSASDVHRARNAAAHRR